MKRSLIITICYIVPLSSYPPRPAPSPPASSAPCSNNSSRQRTLPQLSQRHTCSRCWRLMLPSRPLLQQSCKLHAERSRHSRLPLQHSCKPSSQITKLTQLHSWKPPSRPTNQRLPHSCRPHELLTVQSCPQQSRLRSRLSERGQMRRLQRPAQG